MNRIILESIKIKEKSIDNNINFLFDDNSLVPTLSLTILKDTNLLIKQTSTKEEKLNINIDLNKNVKFNLIDIKENGNYKIAYKFNLDENSYLNIVKINDINQTKEQLIFNLNGKNAKVDYLFKTISKEEENYDIVVYHNHSYTYSNIINHGVNIKKGQLKFEVSGFIPKKIKKCNTNQKNRIINLTDNKCEIKPNLFIDENDVIANHSAHIGKCSDEQLFYLQSRGIGEKEAESLLIKGFLMQKLNDQKETMENIINRYWR